MENLQARIYQQRYQKTVKTQLDTILQNLQRNSYTTISDYLSDCYDNGYIGAMYAIQAQGVPIISPINQNQVVKAIQTDSKLSVRMYDRLGEDVTALKSAVSAQLARRIASGSTWTQVAKELTNHMTSPFTTAVYNAVRIARTEGHRVQQAAQMDALNAAKENGADVVKQWDSTLDDRTRPEHQRLDGQMKELDEYFEIDGYRAKYPGNFGRPEMDINCRCCMLQRARWALDEDELETLKERAEFFGLDKTRDFSDYRDKYLSIGTNSAINTIDRNTASGNPGAIVHFDVALNKRQQSLLDALPNYDSRVTVAKSSVSMRDLSALTAKTGVEYAMFTKGSERMIVRGNAVRVRIDVETAKAMRNEGYKWSGHTHPGVDDLCMAASNGDYLILKAFGQKRGIVYNSMGKRQLFGLG